MVVWTLAFLVNLDEIKISPGHLNQCREVFVYLYFFLTVRSTGCSCSIGSMFGVGGDSVRFAFFSFFHLFFFCSFVSFSSLVCFFSFVSFFSFFCFVCCREYFNFFIFLTGRGRRLSLLIVGGDGRDEF